MNDKIIDTMCVRWQILEILKILKKPVRHLLVGHGLLQACQSGGLSEQPMPL